MISTFKIEIKFIIICGVVDGHIVNYAITNSENEGEAFTP